MKAAERWPSEKENVKTQILTLKEMLEQLEQEKKAIQKATLANVEELIIPIIHKLRMTGSPTQQENLDLLERNLTELIASFEGSCLKDFNKLTPKEIEICNRIKNGMSNKEIAELLNISPLTVHSHRNKIRKKLRLCHQKVNLISYLKMMV